MRKIVCAILTLCLFACSNGDDIKSAESVFNMDEHQFADAFNTAAKSLRQPFRIEQIDIKVSTIDDYFRQQLSDDTSLTVAFSEESGRISSISGLVAEKNGHVDMYALQIIAKIIMHTTSPELSKEKVSKVVADMIREATDQDAPIIPQRFFGHTRYTLRNRKNIGFWLLANPA